METVESFENNVFFFTFTFTHIFFIKKSHQLSPPFKTLRCFHCLFSFIFYPISVSVQHNCTKILTWQASWRRQSNVCWDECHISIRPHKTLIHHVSVCMSVNILGSLTWKCMTQMCIFSWSQRFHSIMQGQSSSP